MPNSLTILTIYTCTGIAPGYLLRYRYDYYPSFSSGQAYNHSPPSHPNNPDMSQHFTVASPDMLPWKYVPPIRHHQVTSRGRNTLFSKRLRLHNRFTPHRGNPHPNTSIISCYYFQDLLTKPLHTRSHKSFNRITLPSYTTKSNRSHTQITSLPFSPTLDSVGTL